MEAKRQELRYRDAPSDKDMEVFKNIMANFETLSGRFVRDVVMKASNGDIMNAMQRCILTLYTYDSKPEDNSAENVLRQSIEMIAKLPLIAVYSYHSYRHFRKDETLFIRHPQKDLSLAENILLMLRPDGKYTELEAKGSGWTALRKSGYTGSVFPAPPSVPLSKRTPSRTRHSSVTSPQEKRLVKEAVKASLFP